MKFFAVFAFSLAVCTAQPVFRVLSMVNTTVASVYAGAPPPTLWADSDTAPTTIGFFAHEGGESNYAILARASVATNGTLSGLATSAISEDSGSNYVTGRIVRSVTTVCFCRQIMHCVNTADAYYEVTPFTAHPEYWTAGCALDPDTDTATFLYHIAAAATTAVICRIPMSQIPTTNADMPYNASWCSAEFTMPFSYVGTTSGMHVTPGGRYATVSITTDTANEVLLFDVDACIAGSTTSCMTTVTEPSASFGLATTAGDITAVLGIGADPWYQSAASITLHRTFTLDNVTKPMAAIADVFHAGGLVYATAIDDIARVYYALTGRGTLVRAALSGFTDAELTEIQVCETSAPGAHAIMPLRNGVVIVGCISVAAPRKLELAVIQTADCTRATVAACLSDPVYCMWNLYTQTCTLRSIGALGECVGANAGHCIDEIPTIVSIAPQVGLMFGGLAVNVTISADIWDDPSIRCTFGAYESNGQYDAATRTVMCLTPEVVAGGRFTVNVEYLGAALDPASDITFVFLDCNEFGVCTIPDECPAECAADLDCAGRLIANGTECATSECVDNTCVFTPRALGYACLGTGECDGHGSCVPPPECTIADDCVGHMNSSNVDCAEFECVAGVCTLNPLPASTSCGDGGACDGLGGCVPPPECATAEDCAAHLVVNGSACVEFDCVAGLCTLLPMASGSECPDGECNDYGTCIPSPCPPECTVDGNCTVRLGANETECAEFQCLAGECVLVPLVIGTACRGIGECSGTGACIVPSTGGAECATADDCAVRLVANNTECAEFQCVYNACVLMPLAAEEPCRNSGECDGLGACIGATGACDTDADCRDDETLYALGCTIVTCSLLHTCVYTNRSVGSTCVPTLSDAAAQPCSANQTGICDAAGFCMLPDPPTDALENATQCTLDIGCDGAQCFAGNDTCVEIATACSATLPACAELSDAVCNGRGDCAWRVSSACDDGNPCTIDGCNADTGLCTHVQHPTACGGLTAVAVVIAGMVGGLGAVVGILAVAVVYVI
ncbi:MAG: IPT/TIG domain-containing protein [Candidatus Omnitrophota bacterium]